MRLRKERRSRVPEPVTGPCRSGSLQLGYHHPFLGSNFLPNSFWCCNPSGRQPSAPTLGGGRTPMRPASAPLERTSSNAFESSSHSLEQVMELEMTSLALLTGQASGLDDALPVSSLLAMALPPLGVVPVGETEGDSTVA